MSAVHELQGAQAEIARLRSSLGESQAREAELRAALGDAPHWPTCKVGQTSGTRPIGCTCYRQQLDAALARPADDTALREAIASRDAEWRACLAAHATGLPAILQQCVFDSNKNARSVERIETLLLVTDHLRDKGFGELATYIQKLLAETPSGSALREFGLKVARLAYDAGLDRPIPHTDQAALVDAVLRGEQ